MIARRCSLALVLLVSVLAFAPVARAKTVVKMASLVPDGSVWDRVLRDMGAEWQEATGGEVSMTLYPGGVAGDEPDLVRKMRIGQIQAAALSTTGLALLDAGFEVFQLPMFFDSYEELYAVVHGLEPEMAKRLEATGFVLLHWAPGGWVHLFSKTQVKTPADLKKLKLFSWAGNDDMVQLFRENGFQPVPLAATDILPSLQTGLIDALPTTPLAALSLQWFRQTPFMQDLGFAPLVGATVISKKTWDKLSPDVQAKLKSAAKKAQDELEKEVPKQDASAVVQMKERGLQVVPIDAATEAEWQQLAETFATAKRRSMAAKELLDDVRRLRDEARKAAAAH